MRLEAAAVEKWFFRGKGDRNRFYAVQKTDLALASGKVTVLTGRSGSGKTTLMHMMAGLLVPDGGQVLLDGKDLYALDDASLSRLRNQTFGMIPQGADVMPELTVLENILLPRGICMRERDSAYAETKENCLRLLKQLEISGLLDVRAKELSGGERRRVCIARALASRPAVVFADEPTSDLDDESTRTALSVLRQAADDGCAVMIVSHDIEAMDYADEKRKMDGGHL